MAKLILLVLGHCFGSANAFLAFKPNCSYPPEIVNYVSEPQVRGTLSVVWSCVTVLILCTWSIQHLSVPLEHDRNRAPSWARRQGLKCLAGFTGLIKRKKKPIPWNQFFDEVRWNVNRARWMLLVIMAPEFYFAKALTENQAANDSRKEYRDEFGDEQWTTMHAFFANMRGFVMKFETTAVQTSLEPSPPTDEGRELAKPRPGGWPTVYFEQDATHAEDLELKHCRLYCQEDCPYRQGDHTVMGKDRPSLSVMKASRKEAIERSWTDGDLESPRPMLQTAFLTTLNTALFSYGADTPKSPLPWSGATLTNSPEALRQASVDSAAIRALARSGTVQSQVIEEDSEEEGRSLSRGQTRVSVAPRLPSGDPGSTGSMSRPKLIPHKRWTGTWPLNAQQLLHAYRRGLLPAPPYISSDHLRNQSKADVMVKILTVWQVLWLVIEILARSAQSIPTTLLEVTVLAFAATAIATYILLWEKPQDVKVAQEITALRPISREDVIELAARAPLSTLMVYEFWLHGVAVRGMGDGVFPFTRGIKVPSLRISRLWKTKWWLPRRQHRRKSVADKEQEVGAEHEHDNDTVTAGDAATPAPDEATYINTVPLGLSVGGAIFGAVHLAGTDFHFPTEIERTLWIISCSVLVGLPSIMVGIYSGYMHYTKVEQGQERDDSKVNTVLTWFGRALIPIYLLARIYLLVEAVRSLVYSPPAVWQVVQWPSAIPHYM